METESVETTSRVMIEAQGISKYYGPFVAVEDISFSISEGQIVAFLGPNGAGKSTTMKILTGFLAASQGKALIAGKRTSTRIASRPPGHWVTSQRMGLSTWK